MLLSLVVAFVGLLIYGLFSHSKVEEAGRLAYFAGLLAFLLTAGSKVVSLFG